MTRTHRLLLPVVLASTFSLGGCLFRSKPVQVRMSTAPLQTATRQDLVSRVNTAAAKMRTLNATVDIDTSVGGSTKGKVTEYAEIRGYILARKPAMLRMIGLFPIVRNRAFDMVSNGSEFKLWVPPKNKFIVGSNEITKPAKQPLENLRPQHIYDALLLREIDPDKEIAVLEQGTERVLDEATQRLAFQPDYTLDVIRRGDGGWFLSRKIRFSRTDLQPRMQVVYDKAGYVATEAHYKDFKDYDGVQFPSRISIWRPQEEYSITLSMVKLAINQPLKDEQFVLNQPPGAEVVRLNGTPASAKAAANPPPAR